MEIRKEIHSEHEGQPMQRCSSDRSWSGPARPVCLNHRVYEEVQYTIRLERPVKARLKGFKIPKE